MLLWFFVVAFHLLLWKMGCKEGDGQRSEYISFNPVFLSNSVENGRWSLEAV